jgi:hypothetical protein
MAIAFGSWLSLAGIAHNLTRAAGCLTGATMAKARSATIRRKIVNVAAKIVRHARTRDDASAGGSRLCRWVIVA